MIPQNGRANEAMYGGDVQILDAAFSGYPAVSGTFSNKCSGTMVSPTIGITARHCFCGAVSNPPTLNFTLPQGPFSSPLTQIFVHDAPFDLCADPNFETHLTVSDIAAFQIADPVPANLVDVYPDIFLGQDIFSYALPYALGQGGVSYVVAQCGFGATVPDGPPPSDKHRRCGNIGPGFIYEGSTSWRGKVSSWMRMRVPPLIHSPPMGRATRVAASLFNRSTQTERRSEHRSSSVR